MNNVIPTDFIVAQGNAFFLHDGAIMAAPVLTKWGGEVEWTEAVEVVRQDTEDTRVVDAIIIALHTIAASELDRVLDPAIEPNEDLRLSFAPSAIREHFDGDDDYGTIIEDLTDEELAGIGEDALYQNDELYEAFHRGLVWALVDRGLASAEDM